MSITQISSKQLGEDATCGFCQAGSTISFNWKYAQEQNDPDLPNDKNLYLAPVQLKSGALYQCKNCDSYWYLDANEQFMNYVEDSRVPLILEWSRSYLKLENHHLEILRSIGRTPPDLYGNGSEFDETPCRVKTISGEVFDLAIVSVQQHAPFESWRNYKLASEISEISPSPYALPYEVRKATSQADEIRMGFAPTLVKLSNGEKLILNWTQNFLKKQGVESSGTTVCAEPLSMENMPNIYHLNDEVIYFIVDPEQEEVETASNKAINSDTRKPGLIRKLLQLLGAG